MEEAETYASAAAAAAAAATTTWVRSSVMCIAEPSSSVPVDSRVSKQKKKMEVGENLVLELGRRPTVMADDQVVRPAKRVRSGSPGNSGNSASFCQVDSCRVNLSDAKDYYRRHKVCDVHSKSAKALVGKRMQRFCQQCSRFHILREFDGEKRSCRNRLDCHNRRRRKIQPEDVPSRLGTQDGRPGTGDSDDYVVRELLARLQESSEVIATNSSSLPENYSFVSTVDKISSTSARNSCTVAPRYFDLNVPQNSQLSGHLYGGKDGLSGPSTLNLLPVAPAPKYSSSGNLVTLESSNKSGESKTELSLIHNSTGTSSYKNSNVELQSIGDCSHQPSLDVEEHAAGNARLTLSLQIFNTVNDDSPPKSGSPRKSLHSKNSVLMGKIPSLFPHDEKRLSTDHASGNLDYERVPVSGESIKMAVASAGPGCSSSLHIRKSTEGRSISHIESPKFPSHETSISSSVSDHYPSSSRSAAQDITDRIIFKLLNKQPGDIPQMLRTQILNWLSHCPSEMESYIRPGCVVLAIYLSMSLKAWNELEEDLPSRVDLLLQGPGADFLRSGRFLIQTNQKLASYNYGKVLFCKIWKKWNSPVLLLVSPLAVVSGKDTPLILRGQNLNLPGTRIHCTYMGGYISKEVLGSTSCGSLNNLSLVSFNFPGGPPNILGRCFIEVENGLRGNSFPVIVADSGICEELRHLEPELEDITTTIIADHKRIHSREDIMHFLNELGWLFQRRNAPSIHFLANFSCTRFKFLLTFSIERDWLVLVKRLLDMLFDNNSGRYVVISESVVFLSELQLLNKAVERKCRKMIDMLLHYFLDDAVNTSRFYPFTPNYKGPANFTPLHLAASLQGSEDLVDALTNDPQEIGLNSWNTLKDDNGETPCSYAWARNNHSYNRIVARKLVDKRNHQLSITVENESSLDTSSTDVQPAQPHSGPPATRSCVQCMILEKMKQRRNFHSKGPLYRPFANMLLGLAAVCACVCLMLRGKPNLGSIAPFKWSNLGYGSL